MLALVPVALVLGFVAGWFVKARLNRRYKTLWLQAVSQLEDKNLFEATGPAPPQVVDTPAMTTQIGYGVHELRPRLVSAQPQPQPQYVAGKWALDETHEKNGTAVFRAVRRGFDPVELGRTANFQRFGALYRRDKEQALTAIKEMNER